MKSSSRAPFKKSILRACFIVWVLCMLCEPICCHALWLPWAKEEDKVKKVVEDVWKALLWNDKKSLKEIVAGPAAQVFVDQQVADIKKNNVKKYECRFKSVNVDRVQGKIAFAEYSRIATLGDGRVVTESLVSVVEKIGGQWKLLPGHKKKDNASNKKTNLLSNTLRQPAVSNASPASNITPIQVK
jgi:formylmethanofuran dehydrogenase subunit E-like metal-binding protein